MESRDLDALRDHYVNTDLSAAIESAVWETEVQPEPMIVTSIRLPKSLLDWVREQAAGEQLKPTALIRRWIEDRRGVSAGRPIPGEENTVAGLAERVSRLEAVALQIVAAEREVEDDSMTDLLAALRASVEQASTKQAPRHPEHDRRGA